MSQTLVKQHLTSTTGQRCFGDSEIVPDYDSVWIVGGCKIPKSLLLHTPVALVTADHLQLSAGPTHPEEPVLLQTPSRGLLSAKLSSFRGPAMGGDPERGGEKQHF